jgi:imidazolonepropionase-like amidohydrolase
MRHRPKALRALAAVLALVPAACAPAASALQPVPHTGLTPEIQPAAGTYAFTNVSVIPLDSERVLRDQTVIVRDGRIAALGPAASTPVPAGATQVEGRGRYLIPGLAEMHGHLPFQEGAQATNTLFLYIAGGVTTVRGMQGHPVQLELRRQVNAGQLVGPRLWLSGPALSGNAAGDPATGERLVREQHAAGFDLLKIHEGLSPETYAAIMRTARELGIPAGGHVPDAVGLDGALAARQTTIDHLDNYIDALQPPGSPALAASGAERARLLALHADRGRIPQLVRATRDAGVAVVPTMPLWEVLIGAASLEQLQALPELRYMPAQTVSNWVTAHRNRLNAIDAQAARQHARIRDELLKAMSDGGVTILLGSDAPQQFSVPGFSIHNEMEHMVRAGMTPYEVLRSGTVAVAGHLGIGDRAGTIAVGRNADLVLLEANPLENISAVRRQAGVMVAGHWHAADAIARRLGEIEASSR